MTAFWGTAPCSPVKGNRRFRDACLVLTMKTRGTSETSLSFYQTTRCNISEGCHLHKPGCITNYIEHSPWESNSSASWQEIPACCITHVRNSRPMVPALSQKNPIHIVKPSLFKNDFSMLLNSTSRTSKSLSTSCSVSKIFMYFIPSARSCYNPLPSHPPLITLIISVEGQKLWSSSHEDFPHDYQNLCMSTLIRLFEYPQQPQTVNCSGQT
jgi:hypothetical protein